jgi:hypothetical protein
MLLCSAVVFYGCFSSHVENSTTSELEPYVEDAPSYYKIMFIHLKDSSVIDVFGRNPKYMKQYGNLKDVIVYDSTKKHAGIIKAENISHLTIEKFTFNAGMTVLTVVVSAVAVLGILFYLYIQAMGGMH